MFCKLLFSILLILNVTQWSFGQQTNTSQKSDSAHVYRKIETYSKKSGFTKFLHGLVFKPLENTHSKLKKVKKRKLQKPFKVFEGKIIRNIEILTLDPFGYTVKDTNVIVQNKLYNYGNRLHLKTQEITIRNLLLFRKNTPFDSLFVKESERLIRSQKYVQEVSIYSSIVGKNSDSVDVLIRVLDLWSIIPTGSISPSQVTFQINEKNFLGLGHGFQNSFSWNHSNGNNIFNSYYYIPNIRNTYINSTFHYGMDENKNYIKSINVDRPFYSPFAKWAGGMYFENQKRIDTIHQNEPNYLLKYYMFNTQEYWGGSSHQIYKGNSENDRTTNLIFSMRYLRMRYNKMSINDYDSLHLFTNEDFYLSGIGISTRKYVQDKYIFNYGIIEDVPIGKVYGLTGGYQVKNNTGRYYLGLRFSNGNYYDWGYLSCNLEYGTFFHLEHLEQSVFVAEVNYFTDLFEIGKWKFRQFIKPQLTLGFNRLATDNLTINNENGIAGFNSTFLSGSKKIVITLQTQSYAPWNVIGFRFGPYLLCSLGMLGDNIYGFEKSKIYSKLGLGLLIKNEFLVFNIIQISFDFYPAIPGEGNNIFKINQEKSSDFGLQNFEIGKPVPVIYQ